MWYNQLSIGMQIPFLLQKKVGVEEEEATLVQWLVLLLES